MVVGLTTTCAISAYHHKSCEFEPRSWWYSTGRWFSPGTPVFSTNRTDCYNRTEILLKVALITITLAPIFYYYFFYLGRFFACCCSWSIVYLLHLKYKPVYNESYITRSSFMFLLKFTSYTTSQSDFLHHVFSYTCFGSFYMVSFGDRRWRDRKVYSIQYYVIKLVSDLRQVGGFLHKLVKHHNPNP